MGWARPCCWASWALDGRLMPVRGALGMAITAAGQGVRALVLPRANARECECVEGLTLYPAETLLQVLEHLSGKTPLTAHPAARYEALAPDTPMAFDLKYVKGQPRDARRWKLPQRADTTC